MLGELIFESRGEIIGQRVLSIENGIPKLAVSVKGIGKFEDRTELTEIWTYWNISKSVGVTYGEGKGVFMTIDGTEIATASGRGIGKLTNEGNVRWVGEIFFSTNSSNRLAYLDHLIAVNEDKVDPSGSYVHKLWEWK